ncbi:MAG: DUF5050 domain-containing protein [Clostridia bacterium]|nr:DUF5050 domain-containing protein [Clostridia bacterium]
MKKLIALTLTMIFAIAPLWGCGQKVNDSDVDQTEELQGGATQNEVTKSNAPSSDGFHVDLDYFRADRYAATITEDADHVFWADNDGLHKYSKDTKNTVLLLEGKGINSLVVCENFLYYVVDDEILYRIDVDSKAVETVFKQDDKYMCQIYDYTVADGKVFFLNTHSLFYYDIATKSVKELKDTTVETLQVVGDDIYFIDHAERTDTIYVYSMTDGTCEIVLGNGEHTPMEEAYIDFRIVNNRMYYTQSTPSGTYVMNSAGESKIIGDGCAVFVCESNVAGGTYFMAYGRDESSLKFRGQDGVPVPICFDMMELNVNFGVAIVNGYVYYNSGFDRVLNETGHYIYNYYSNPMAKKIVDPSKYNLRDGYYTIG